VTDHERCDFEFAPGVRCMLIAGHDEPYYAYLDRGQWGEYSTLLGAGTEHAVFAPPQPVPPRSEWTGAERKDTVPRLRATQPQTRGASEQEGDAR
jgi:hypothetical protein